MLSYIVFGLFIVVTALYTAVNRSRRLHNVPGPWVCSYTDLWRTYRQNTGNYSNLLAQLHTKYGPVVRIGPNTVSVSKASAIPTIFTMRGEFQKAESYKCLATWVNGAVQGSVLDIRDESQSSNLKRAFGAAFAVKNVQDYEGLVETSSANLMNRLDQKGTVDIFDAMSRFQIDFLLKAAFSEDTVLCDNDEDIRQYSFHPRLQHWTRWQSAQRFEHLLYKSLLVNKIWYMFCTPSRPAWAVLTNGFLQRRVSKQTASRGQKDLLDKYLDAQRKHPDTIDIGTVRRMVASTINAGFDTTAYTISTVLFELLKNPNAMKSLRKELLQAQKAGLLSNVPQWTEVNKLPYLDAVIKEAMRTNHLLNVPLEREVPEGGADVCGYNLPAGTVVGCSVELIGKDTECYGPDADCFNPSRWLTEDLAKRTAMERGFLGFGSGKRGCVGRHIALLEMKKLIPTILMNFEMKLVDPNAVVESTDGFTNFPKPIEMSFNKIGG